ncbi:GHMP family kinase ATP-binding protein [Gemella morbillorum]
MIISKTPLRMSFFGGGTDFADYYKNSRYGYGAVISTALDMYVYIMVCKRFDDKIRVCYTINEFVDSVDQIQHNIIREALKMLHIEKGIDIVYSADIPLSSAGIGLASSSALAVGVLNALHAYKGEHVSPDTLAREACEI